jgi:hypothetical protein
MKFHQSKKLKDGSRLVTLQVDEDAWLVAEQAWQRLLFTGPEDYLNGVLNTAMMGEIEQFNEYEERREREAGIPPPVIERPATPSDDPDDLDDGIPF